MEGTLVHSLFHGLLGLHLEATTDGVEGVVEGTGGDSGDLSGEESRDESHDAEVLLVGVESHDGIEQTELETTVDDDTSDGGTESVVDGQGSLSGGGLLEAIENTVEGLFFSTDIGGETGTGEIKRVADTQREGSTETSRGKVDSEETPEVLLGITLGHEFLDGVFERQVEGLLREVSDNIGTISSPEGGKALLGGNTSEAISHSGVTGNLSRDNLGVSILGLDEELNTLDGSSCGLSNSTDKSTNAEIEEPSLESGLLRHNFRDILIIMYSRRLKFKTSLDAL
jgi:hypothetical protein